MATTTPPPEASDEALAAKRDLAALYDRYASRMLAYVSSRGVPAHDIDDTLQDLWMRVHKGLEAKPFSGHFSGWLFQIARHVIFDRARKPAGPEGLPDVDRTADKDTPPHLLTQREVREQLERCLGHLEERDREIVRARTAGEGYEEVCESLRIEKNAAYKIFHKATARLADCMKRAGYEPGSGDDP